MELELLTIFELAKILKVSETSIYRYMKQGMPKIKVGHNTRFQIEEVIEWLKERGK